jgi:D-amino peptidase
MRVFVSIDMEGVAGVAQLRQVMRGSEDFPESRRLMTEEANAAIAGALDAGATHVVVNDSHGTMDNLLAEALDPRAELVIGSPKPLSMMEGFGEGFDVALFVAYHAAAGAQAAVLDHTYSGRLIYEARVNGQPWTEAELNAAFAGTYGTPVGLITGDDKACQVAARLPGDVVAVVVKQGLGRNVAQGVHPSIARGLIREGAAEAVRAATAGSLEPFVPAGPFVLEADLANSGCADLCSIMPGVDRTGPRTVRFETPAFRDAFRCLLAWTYLGDSQAPRYPS